jgi:hypothetical protein
MTPKAEPPDHSVAGVGGSGCTGDDGRSHFLNWIGIGDSASGGLGHSGEASAGQAVMMSPGSQERSRL